MGGTSAALRQRVDGRSAAAGDEMRALPRPLSPAVRGYGFAFSRSVLAVRVTGGAKPWIQGDLPGGAPFDDGKRARRKKSSSEEPL